MRENIQNLTSFSHFQQKVMKAKHIGFNNDHTINILSYYVPYTEVSLRDGDRDKFIHIHTLQFKV